jgi:hypothetical protein
MDVRMQGNMQYVFHDVCHIQIITYFYGWCTVLETLGPWCLPDKKLVVPREKLERQFEDAVLQSFDDDGRRSIFEELYLPRNLSIFDQIHETLATVIPNMLRPAR